jgi:hypothetical protein
MEEYTIKKAIEYLKEPLEKQGRKISKIGLQAACQRGTIKARHTNPENPRRGEWLIPESSLDDYINNPPKSGNPRGFNAAARVARWHNDDKE